MARKWRKGVSQETYELIRNRYKNGETTRKISKDMYVPLWTVQRYIQDMARKPKHGLSKHPLHTVWLGMRSRCNNPKAINYKWYGGKGIKVCDEWNTSFENFYEWAIRNGYIYLKKGIRNYLTLDRIDSNGNYCPTNCRWVNQHIQNARQSVNTRNTTGYKGVYPDKQYGGFLAEVTVCNKTEFLGKYKTARLAALARDKFIKKSNLREYELQILNWEE